MPTDQSFWPLASNPWRLKKGLVYKITTQGLSNSDTSWDGVKKALNEKEIVRWTKAEIKMCLGSVMTKPKFRLLSLYEEAESAKPGVTLAQQTMSNSTACVHLGPVPWPSSFTQGRGGVRLLSRPPTWSLQTAEEVQWLCFTVRNVTCAENIHAISHWWSYKEWFSFN